MFFFFFCDELESKKSGKVKTNKYRAGVYNTKYFVYDNTLD